MEANGTSREPVCMVLLNLPLNGSEVERGTGHPDFGFRDDYMWLPMIGNFQIQINPIWCPLETLLTKGQGGTA